MPFDPDRLRQAADDPEWGQPPPLGDYVVKFARGSTLTSKAGASFLKLTFQIAEGRLRNHEWASLHTLEDSFGLAITAAQLKALGIDLNKVTSEDELTNLVAEREGRLYDVRVTESEDKRWINTAVRGEHRQQRTLPGVFDEPTNGDSKAAADRDSWAEFVKPAEPVPAGPPADDDPPF